VMHFLHRQGDFAQAVRPDLLLLDLNLPKRHGRQVLTDVKSDAGLCSIPVVVLTSSSATHDVVDSYRRGASCVVTKATNFEQLVTIVRGIEGFWLRLVTYPPRMNGTSG